MKLDSTGIINFQKIYGGILQDNIYDFKILSDSGFLLVGTSNSYSTGNSDAWVIRLNSFGDTLWTTTIGTSIIESSYSLFLNDPDKIWICGKANTTIPNGDQGWLFEIDSTGNLKNTLFFGGSKNELLSDISIINYNLFAIGKSSVNLNDSIYFVRLDSLTLDSRAYFTEINFEHTIFPNPTESHVFFKINQSSPSLKNNIHVYDMNGKEYFCNIEQVEQTLKITLPEFKGTYIIYFNIEKINYTYKVLKN